jgi:hypothetical protein
MTKKSMAIVIALTTSAKSFRTIPITGGLPQGAAKAERPRRLGARLQPRPPGASFTVNGAGAAEDAGARVRRRRALLRVHEQKGSCCNKP